METAPKNPALEEDKYKKAQGRQASKREKDTKFLDGDSLDSDLVDPSELDQDLPPEETEDHDEWDDRQNENDINDKEREFLLTLFALLHSTKKLLKFLFIRKYQVWLNNR